MITPHSACATAQAKTLSHSPAAFEPASVRAATVLCCELEKALYFNALSKTRSALNNLAELRATRINKLTALFLSKHEAFAPLLARLTKNYWLSLTDEEKSQRANIRQQSIARKRERELLDGISVRKKIAQKFFKAHQLNQPIRLSQVELAWLERNRECLAVVSIKSKFLVPSSRAAFDFSEEAYSQLAARLRFEMLAPSDVNILRAHGAPILPDNALSLDDANWAREPYAKAVLYRLIKYRKDEQAEQAERMKSASPPAVEKPFKRVHLCEEELSSAEPFVARLNASQEPTAQPRCAATLVAQPLKRVELDEDEAACEIASGATSQRQWIEKIKEKARELFGFQTKLRALAG